MLALGVRVVTDTRDQDIHAERNWADRLRRSEAVLAQKIGLVLQRDLSVNSHPLRRAESAVGLVPSARHDRDCHSRRDRMIKKVHHIAVAVEDLDKSLAIYTDVLGLQGKVMEMASYSVKLALIQVGDVLVEFIQPTSDNDSLGFAKSCVRRARDSIIWPTRSKI